jgi:serine/threonine protein kinase
MFFWVIDFIAFNYHKNNLFHGDIKPDNIFFNDEDDDFYMTTDIGSLLYLGERNETE